MKSLTTISNWIWMAPAPTILCRVGQNHVYMYGVYARWDVVCPCIHWVVQNTKQHSTFLVHAGGVYTICVLFPFSLVCFFWQGNHQKTPSYRVYIPYMVLANPTSVTCSFHHLQILASPAEMCAARGYLLPLQQLRPLPCARPLLPSGAALGPEEIVYNILWLIVCV